jgi:hypothetical protein
MEHDAHAACAGGATSLWRRIAWSPSSSEGLRRRIWRASTCAEPSFSPWDAMQADCSQGWLKIPRRLPPVSARSEVTTTRLRVDSKSMIYNDINLVSEGKALSQLARPNPETAWKQGHPLVLQPCATRVAVRRASFGMQQRMAKLDSALSHSIPEHWRLEL